MRAYLFSLMVAGATLGPLTFASAQTAEPVSAADAQTDSHIDYGPLNLLIEKLAIDIRDRPSFAYGHIRKTALPYLAKYSAILARENTANLSQDVQLAYWLNLHNLLVVAAIATDAKSTDIKSLRGAGSTPGDLWTAQRIEKDGQSMSIADIETIILGRWSEPEVLFGLYQGIKGGPRMHAKAFHGSSVRSDLKAAASTYINAKGVVKVKKEKAEISPVFLWYQPSLFGGSDDVLLEYLAAHAEPKLSNKLSNVTSVAERKISYKTDIFEPNRAGAGTSSASPTGGRGYGS